jgi:hypothetical protein
MIFTKQEIQENFPLNERIKLEKTKSQNSVVYWINELVSQSVPGVDDVPGLIALNKNITEQVEDLYKEKEELLSAFPGLHSTHDLIEMVRDMENQLIELYKEKEN